MKKILLFLFLGSVGFTAYSCDNNDDAVVQNPVDYDTYSTAYDIIPTFTKTNNNLYHFDDAFNKPLVESDVVLIYLQTGLTNNNSPIWSLLPYSVALNNGNNDRVDYVFDFSAYDIGINVKSTPTLNLDNNSSYYTNKKFRVVVVPAKTGTSKSAEAAAVNYEDYNSVIKYYNIDESKIQTKVK
ncbi:hypothetical protein B0A69_17650 [Chryseobacterium shigense]|uniref:DUF1735 domain-containing protein n=1 Tax=Chryseobacterium shigense TaxID=297244 RepID=A0A1N7ICX3_9FLAO|nr:hypothetical protein [Chryseobacterium shigense]PQA91624.1 hypothetical protein B0A69_17650 [Chryseobacterium shigense]SIS34919.1 hypothetical protein SAMN05421639_103115 [Chryseobacterium shigense]